MTLQPLHTVDAALVDAASARLRDALAGQPLVVAERFTTSGRTTYTGPSAITAARPHLAIGCYLARGPAAPQRLLAAERTTRIRGPQQRHSWTRVVDAPARRLLGRVDQPPVIAAWYSTPQLEAWAGPGGTVAAIDGALRQAVEAKPAFGLLLTQAEVPEALHIPAVRVERLGELRELQQAVGSQRLVVQAGTESGGRGTHFVTTEEDLGRAARMPGPYRVAAFVEGWSSNTTVLSVPNTSGGVDVYVDRPSHKGVGVPEAGIGPGKSAGNTWSRPWPAAAAQALVDAAVRIGRWAWHTHRMCGLFGLDAILTPDGRVQLNEINCRNQGTTEVSGVNQQLRGLPPFLVAHLTTLLGGRVDWLPEPDAFNQATIDTATRSGPGPFYLKLRNRHPHPVRVNLPGPGLYQLRDGHLDFLAPGAHPANARAELGQVLLANLPAPEVTCLPDAELGTAEGLATGPAGPFAGPHQLSDYGRRIQSALDHHLTCLTEELTL